MAFNYKTEYERYRRYYQSLEPTFKTSATSSYTMAIFSFLAISLFGWYGIRPTVQTILFLRREIADNTEVSKRMENKITQLVEAQAAYQNAADNLVILDQALPQDPNVLRVVGQLQSLAKSTNSSLSAVQVPTVPLASSQATPSAGTGGEKVTDIPIVVAVNGTYTAIKSFLDGLVSMRKRS
ncbi:hypothetical protein HYV22_03580 [Candidatus Gottesmanbacteria bacterium]|nr:hypothetical protein [Candidatus Gottesmanbacteria bacterium]